MNNSEKPSETSQPAMLTPIVLPEAVPASTEEAHGKIRTPYIQSSDDARKARGTKESVVAVVMSVSEPGMTVIGQVTDAGPVARRSILKHPSPSA